LNLSPMRATKLDGITAPDALLTFEAL